MIGRRSGFSLLEALVALVIIAATASAASGMLGQSIVAVEHARSRESRLRDAGRFLDAVSLWTTGDLDRRLGDREQGPWRLTIQSLGSRLYSVELRDSSEMLLKTVLYRPRGGRE
jgi:prepilin-type N-terminal cleavage/methylation domain-containing protein